MLHKRTRRYTKGEKKGKKKGKNTHTHAFLAQKKKKKKKKKKQQQQTSRKQQAQTHRQQSSTKHHIQGVLLTYQHFEITYAPHLLTCPCSCLVSPWSTQTLRSAQANVSVTKTLKK
jgi:hypothetical protein